MDTEMEARLQVLLDKQEIHDALMRYARGADRHDPELLLSAYHDDAYADYGGFKGSPKVMAESIAKLPDYPMQHFIGNVLIEVDGDVAYSEAYFISISEQTDGDQKFTRARVSRFLDRFEKRQGQWKIAQRKMVDDLARRDPLPDAPAAASSNRGSASKADPVYRIRDLTVPQTA